MKSIKNIMIAGSLVVALYSNSALADREVHVQDDFKCNSISFPYPEAVINFSVIYKSTFSNPETREGEKKSKFGEVKIDGNTYSNCDLRWSKKPWVKSVTLASFYCRGHEENIYFTTYPSNDEGPSAQLNVLYHPNSNEDLIGQLLPKGHYNHCKYSGLYRPGS